MMPNIQLSMRKASFYQIHYILTFSVKKLGYFKKSNNLPFKFFILV